jgi:hypothetical protein
MNERTVKTRNVAMIAARITCPHHASGRTGASAGSDPA